MATFVTNYAKQEFLKGDLNIGTDTFKIMLLKTFPTSGFQDDNFIGDMLGHGAAEADATNYTGGFGGGGRKTVTLSAAENDASDNATVTISGGTVTWTALGGAVNNTIVGAALVKEVTNDAASPLIAVFDITDTPTNGSDFTLSFSSSTVLTLS